MPTYIELTDPNHVLRETDEITLAHYCVGDPGSWSGCISLRSHSAHQYIGKTVAQAHEMTVTPFRFRCRVEDIVVTAVPSPSEFAPMHNGERFQVRQLTDRWQIYADGMRHIAMCDKPEYAEMIAQCLNQSASLLTKDTSS